MWTIRFCLILCIGCLGSREGYAQADSVACRLEKIKTTDGDSLRLLYAGEIENFLRQIPFGAYDEQKPVKYLCYKTCGKGVAEMFSWAIPLKEGQAFYNLFHVREGDRWYRISSLDKEENIGEDWLYYDWLSFGYQGQTCYMLFGWKRTAPTNQKILRIVRLGEDGKINSGPACIHKGNEKVASLIFEYAGDGSMMLKQEQDGKRIIFDHLAPNDPKYEGYYMLYGPDGSYDALIRKEDGWVYVTNYHI